MKILIFSIASKKANEKMLWTQKPEETFIHILSDLYSIFNKQELDKLLIITCHMSHLSSWTLLVVRYCILFLIYQDFFGHEGIEMTDFDCRHVQHR